MKKLKLDKKEIETDEILTREQLKKILGGTSGSGIGCSTQNCTLTAQDNHGAWVSFDGSCSTHVIWQNMAGGIYDCFCKTSVSSSPVSLGSNGGSSKCGERFTIP